MIAATLRHLARALGCRDDQAEDVLRSEASARATLSRRAALGLGAAAVGAVATGNLFGELVPEAQTFEVGDFVLPLLKQSLDRAHFAFGRAMGARLYGPMAIVTSVDRKGGIITLG